MRRPQRMILAFLITALLIEITTPVTWALGETANPGILHVEDHQHDSSMDGYAYAEPALSLAYEGPAIVYHESMESAAAELRAAMVAQHSTYTIGFKTSNSPNDSICEEIFELALKHTGVPEEGDSLSWLLESSQWKYSWTGTVGGPNSILITYSLTYYTTPEQNAQLNLAVDALLVELNLGNTTVYEKIRGIYDWMCKNISYDNAHLEDEAYKTKYSAYAALVDRTAVCQGYAVLFYRLALELGIDCRIIGGTGKGEAHSWNIVKLDGKYYNLDATWDAARYQAGQDYDYFLRSDAEFADHIRDSKFLTSTFLSVYPVSETSYELTCARHQFSKIVTSPTCTSKGYTTYTCSLCNSSYQDDWVEAVNHAFVNGACKYCSLKGKAAGYCGDKLVWVLSQSGDLTISGTGDMWDFEETSSPWYAYKDEILHVVIEDGVTSVGRNAFRQYKKLLTVDFGNSIKTIREYAFYMCDSLGNFILPYSLQSIESAAFYYCLSITSVEIPANVTYFGGFSYCENLSYVKFKSDHNFEGQFLVWVYVSAPFEGCPELEEIIVEEGHMKLRTYDGVLFYREDLYQYPAGKKDTTWSIPEGTRDIGQASFRGAVHLEEVSIPGSVRKMYSIAFEGCNKLRKVTIQEGIEEIEAGAFENCSKLTDIILPSSITQIRDSAFAHCKSLTQISLPENLTEISMLAFYECSSLSSITIPSNITRINEMAFYECSSLKEILVAEGNTAYKSVGGVVYTADGKTLVAAPGAITHCDILPGVTEIAEAAFYACRQLKRVTIPDTVVNIGARAFSITDLNEVEFPASVRTIGEECFWSNHSLWKIIFHGAVPQIHSTAFSYVTASVYFPADDQTWGPDVKQQYGGSLVWISSSGESCSHQWIQKETIKAATCVTDGEAVYECVLCGKSERRTITTSGHSWKSATCTDPKTCTKCGTIEGAAAGHTEVVDTAVSAGCNNTGLTEGKHCSVCNTILIVQQIIPATGHTDENTDCTCDICGSSLCINHTEKTIPGVNSSCISTGLTEGKLCSICGEVLVKQEVIPVSDHTMGAWIEIKTPTCTEDGSEQSECSICGHKTEREISANGHNYGKWVQVKKPSAEETGLEERVCDNCGDIESRELAKTAKPEDVPATLPGEGTDDGPAEHGKYVLVTCIGLAVVLSGLGVLIFIKKKK